MKKLTTAFVALAACLFAPVAYAHELNDPETELKMYTEMSLPTVYLSVEHIDAAERITTYGSGTFIASTEQRGNYILTAAHVLSKDEDTSSISGRGWSVKPEDIRVIRVMWYTADLTTMEPKRHVGEAVVIAYDTGKDLAVLRLKGEEAIPYAASIAPRDVLLIPFRKTWVVGETNAQYGPQPTSGSISQLREKSCAFEGGEKVCTTYILSENDSYKSVSGGGLFHYSGPKRDRFELIGVAVQSGIDFLPIPEVPGITVPAHIPHVTLSVPVERIHDFMNEHKLDFLIPKVTS